MGRQIGVVDVIEPLPEDVVNMLVVKGIMFPARRDFQNLGFHRGVETTCHYKAFVPENSGGVQGFNNDIARALYRTDKTDHVIFQNGQITPVIELLRGSIA